MTTATASATGRHKLKSTTIHLMALDGIVNVNSLFTLGFFLWLAVNPTDQRTPLLSPPTPPASCRLPPLKTSSFSMSTLSSFLFSKA
ncbi:hypothetical protein Ccrd_005801 [Cynara cardunculus var. scolymus]|uniref:Uncharacterized protein n=1 Tax=Cynara cardunculus var. scolymus TaxID=59895 RepID=A0A103XJZ0_CYNCS|nr:hypothetical protein Ccrd_005801 [Cynara cardunculus var. scolymus]